MRRTTLPAMGTIGLLIVLTAGCSKDERLAQMARQSTGRQAEQNREMAKLNQQVSENARQLVEADQESRKETIQLQRELVQRDTQCRSELNELQKQLEGGWDAERPENVSASELRIRTM